MTCSKFAIAALSATAIYFAASGGAFAQAATHTDLSGVYSTAGDGVPVELASAGKTVCVFACAPAGGGRRGGGPLIGPGAGPGGAAQLAADRPHYKPEFLAKVKDLNDNQVDKDPSLRCEAPGVPRIGPPKKIIQRQTEVIFLYEDLTGPFFRVIPITNKHRTDVEATPFGDSIGRWDGETFIVETTKLSEDTWLADFGAFHTQNLRVVERLRKVGDAVEWQATSHDWAVLAEPWAQKARLMPPASQEIVIPPRCMDQSLALMQDKSFHGNSR